MGEHIALIRLDDLGIIVAPISILVGGSSAAWNP